MTHDEKSTGIAAVIPLNPKKTYWEKDSTISPSRFFNVWVFQRLLRCPHFREVLDYCLDIYESSFPGTKEALFDNLRADGPDPEILAMLEEPGILAILEEIKDKPGLEKVLAYQLCLFTKSAIL